MDPLQLILRWLHIGPAIVMVGGAFFMLFVLHPSMSVLTDEQRAQLRAAIIKRWKIVVHVGVLLFLISGFYNYLAIQSPLHKKDPLYHILMGVKMLLAISIFFLAELLVGRTKLADKIRQQMPKFLKIILSMALAIVLISGFLKIRGPVTKPTEPTPAIANDAGVPAKTPVVPAKSPEKAEK